MTNPVSPTKVAGRFWFSSSYKTCCPASSIRDRDWSHKCRSLALFEKVTSGRTWFLVSYFVGSQNFPEMTIFENGLKSMLHNKSNSDMPSTKNTRSWKMNKNVFRGDWQKVWAFPSWKTTASFFHNFFSTPLLFVKALATTSSCLQSVDWSVQTWFGMVLMSGLPATYVQRWNFFADLFSHQWKVKFFKAWQKNLKSFRCVKQHKSHQWTMSSCTTSKWMMRKCQVGTLKICWTLYRVVHFLCQLVRDKFPSVSTGKRYSLVFTEPTLSKWPIDTFSFWNAEKWSV